MGDHVLSTNVFWIGTVVATSLYMMNFVVLFEGASDWKLSTWAIVVPSCLGYISLQIKAISEPVAELNEAQQDNHEYQRVTVPDSDTDDTTISKVLLID